MILFCRKYPHWWFDWNLNALRFSNHRSAYLALLDDRYPSTDEKQSVHLNINYPDARTLNRWLPYSSASGSRRLHRTFTSRRDHEPQK